MMVNAAEAPWLPLVEQARQLDPDPALAKVDDEALEDRVRDVASQVAALTCAWLELVAEFVVRGCWADQGARTPGQWLSWACGAGSSTAREHVRVGLALRRLPTIREHFAAGTISYSKVRAITRVATPESQPQLLRIADSAPAADLERIIAGARAQLARQRAGDDPDEVDLADMAAVPTLRRHETRGGVLVEYRLQVPVEVAEQLDQRLDRLVELADRTDTQPTLTDDTDGDPVADAGRPSYGQRQAAALLAALATAVQTGPRDRSGQDRHLVVLHTGAGAFLDAPDADGDDPDGDDPAGASAETDPVPAGTGDDDGTPPDDDRRRPDRTRRRHRPTVVTGRRRSMALPPSVLRLLTCDAVVTATGRGHPADAGREQRTVPEPLGRAVALRDRGCRFPGCRRTRWLHIHHVIHWADGGLTDRANLLTLCSFHHRFVHAANWTLHPIDPAAGHYRFEPATGAATDPTGPLPGASEETPTLVDPWPKALQPPWWEGDPYDLSETINAVAELVLDPATDIAPPRVHPAHDPDIADAA